jgi:predicted TPR repeat methyltransferase
VKPSLDRHYFENVYADTIDPWQFETSDYERNKYDETIAMLGGRRFSSAFEIGCSIGVLTARLAGLTDALLSVDVNAKALAAAEQRCASLSNVAFAEMSVPAQFPSGPFDLVVVSEVAYYWSDADLALAMDRIVASARGGLLELVHFLPPVDDYVRSGDAVHEAFLADPRFSRVRHARADRYRIDVLAIA